MFRIARGKRGKFVGELEQQNEPVAPFEFAEVLANLHEGVG